MADILEDIMVLQSDAERAQRALKTIEKYVVRAKKSAPDIPDSGVGAQITVGVEWLAWMIAFFEGEDEGPEF
jgi:hypothetical protein